MRNIGLTMQECMRKLQAIGIEFESVFKTGKPFTVIFLKSNSPAFLL